MKTNQLVIGILAHVDAGKTTLAESILYQCKSIRKMGRVDHKNAFLDTYALEKERGITIFSKQALFSLGDKAVTLLDTPGHVDFSAEMERVLFVLDYAILVISGTEGIQGHVLTLWKLLRQYQIPVFLFVNKMDQPTADKKWLMEELTRRLDEHCIEFSETKKDEAFYENLAFCNEEVMEHYLENGMIEEEEIAQMIRKRQVFPCYFGSALRMRGVETLLDGMERYCRCPAYPDEFGAKVFKISRELNTNRLTWLKVTGGTLKVKQKLTNRLEEESTRQDRQKQTEEIWEEKADQIRLYSGNQFRTVKEVPAGGVCAVVGLTHTCVGQGLGIEPPSKRPILEPVLTYQIILPPGCDIHGMYVKLCTLEEEEPQLHIVWEEASNEIHAQVMGAVQVEILQSMIKERFGVDVAFGAGSIVYKETIIEPIEGVGHFEPLRHYAEVHLLLEPSERGSGVTFDSVCSEDVLDKNWQRLILTHLEEKKHKGVLTGSEITDMKITLLSGRAHQKHTEGGDFRQATYRAVRHGLKSAKSILLEPVFEFTLEILPETVGRAMSDLQKMQASFSQPVLEGGMSVITGSVPVASLGDYQKEVIAYTRGEGRLFCTLKGYEPCHNEEEVIAQRGYDSERDLENPTGSVFCAHGAGFSVDWQDVTKYMHLESAWSLEQKKNEKQKEELLMQRAVLQSSSSRPALAKTSLEEDKELEEIFTRTYGPIRQPRTAFRPVAAESYREKKQPDISPTEYLLVDGYNIIFGWDELRELAKEDMGAARIALMDILSNYQGYKKNTLILVFDAYKVEGYQGEIQKYHNIYIVYTKEAETADQYIEKTVIQIDKRNRITVATSDGVEQLIIMGQGAIRMSAAGLKEEILAASAEIRKNYLSQRSGMKTYLFQNLPDELSDIMEAVRLGRKTLSEESVKNKKENSKKISEKKKNQKKEK